MNDEIIARLACPELLVRGYTVSLAEATATPTALPPGDDDPLREHLSLILGVSIGVGLCILFAIGCFIWLGECMHDKKIISTSYVATSCVATT